MEDLEEVDDVPIILSKKIAASKAVKCKMTPKQLEEREALRKELAEESMDHSGDKVVKKVTRHFLNVFYVNSMQCLCIFYVNSM